MLKFVCMLLVLASSCRNRPEDSVNKSQEVVAAKNPIALINVNRSFKNGEFFETPIDPSRKIVNITVKYDGNYSIPAKDQNGKTITGDEGRTYYRDGMYAHGFVVDGEKKSEVSVPKFIDSNETDNWHDLNDVRGPKFRIEMNYSPRYASDPDVKASGTSIYLESIRIQYADDPDETYQEFRYARNDQDEFASDAKAVRDGGTFTQDLTTDKLIYRIDVRWGDAKPRENGIYIPGQASGTVFFDGQSLGEYRNVAMIETQVWPAVPDVKKTDTHRIDVRFSGDPGRVFWIRVYSRTRP